MEDKPAAMDLLVPESRIVILGEFINNIFLDICKPMTYLAVKSGDPITLYISSPGGDAIEGMAIIDTINRCRSEFEVSTEGVVLGQAMSAAAIILQACDIRIAHKNSVIMLHGPSVVAAGDVKSMEAEQGLMDLIVNIALDLLEKRTKMPRDYWENIMKSSTPKYYTAEQALAEGLIDSIGD